MKVTEFAEQVVFGKTLREKLSVPESITFDEPAKSRSSRLAESIDSPGRPTELKMQLGNHGNVRPSDENLENEKARGKLLHFLANHELLATELMALVLLKFPEAPVAFQRGVYATLLEEQEHTRMYIHRMQQCGVEFGSYPVGGQFWRMVEPMQTPMDFVSRLSLTFEQANLDYSLHFAKVFRQIEDHQTADVLQKIYEDEIGHVRHGLHWFQKWKDPEQSDWEAYQDRLHLPMSPVRGRGPGIEFNRKGRLEAGLSPNFVDAIEVFGKSKGRAVTIRWFDPAAESSLQNTALEDKDSRLMKQLGIDLEYVILAVAKPDDVLLVRQFPPLPLRKHWVQSGIQLPEFVLLDESANIELRNRNIQDFSPWAWTKVSTKFAESLPVRSRQLLTPWKNERNKLFRKSWSTHQLKKWLQAESNGRVENNSWFVDASSVGIPVLERSEIEGALAEIGSRGFKHALFKRDLDASGRGQRRLPCLAPMTSEDLAWLNAIFENRIIQTANAPVGVIEPQLDRVVDLSLLWHWAANEPKPHLLGWTRPLVTVGRRFMGTRLNKEFDDCDDALRQFLLEDRCRRIRTTADWLQARVTENLAHLNHRGYFGIDAMVVENLDGGLAIKPMVELNPRMTMGHIALKLKSRLANGVPAEFRILSLQEWHAFESSASQLAIARDRSGKLTEGVLALSQPNARTKLVPLLLIGRQAVSRLADCLNE